MVVSMTMAVGPQPVTAQRTLARARIGFLVDEPVRTDAVRPSILASWRRSRQMAVAADEVAPIHAVDLELDSPLTRAADPVLRSVADAMDGQPVSVVLTDRRGVVLRRLTADRGLERRLDRVGLAPGFDYGEASVGTNGIGTALEVGATTYVFGHEHFAENLDDLACAGVPIRHPVTGRTVGLVDLTCWQQHAGSLLPALAVTTARQVQDALMGQSTARERQLLDEYLRACRRHPGIVVAVGGTVTMLNDHARATLPAVSQAQLLRHVSEALTDPSPPRRHHLRVELPDGGSARMVLHFVGAPDRPDGVVARVVPVATADPGRRGPARRDDPAPLPGLVGSGPVWLRACAQVEEAFRGGEWLALTGERGVGKRSILRAVQLRAQPVPGLVTLDAAGDGLADWSRRLHLALEGGRSNLLLLDVDRLDPRLLRSTAEMLRSRRPREAPTPPWVAVTVVDGAAGVGLSELLEVFPVTVRVPPLRLHADDVPALTKHFTRRAAAGRGLVWSETALQVLSRGTWPGNVAQLQEVVRSVLARRRSGVVDAAHLPSEVTCLSRRALTVIECLERDAIVDALTDAHGDKTAAAHALGLSRATIYRRIRAFGIVDQVAGTEPAPR